MKNALDIDKNSQEIAKAATVKIEEECVRKRSFALATGALALVKYLKGEGFDFNFKHSLFKIPSFAQNIEIADIYAAVDENNIRFDVRVIFEGENFYVPKTHKKYSAVPDFYAVVRLDKRLNKMEPLGFISSDELGEDVSSDEYYVYDVSLLKPFKGLKKALKNVVGKEISLTKQEHEKISELTVAFSDLQIGESEKIFFIKHVINCAKCRENICEFNEFDGIIAQVKNYPELLEDSTLEVLSGSYVEEKEHGILETDLTPSLFEMVKEISDTAASTGEIAVEAGIVAAQAFSQVEELELVAQEAFVETVQEAVEIVVDSADSDDSDDFLLNIGEKSQTKDEIPSDEEDLDAFSDLTDLSNSEESTECSEEEPVENDEQSFEDELSLDIQAEESDLTQDLLIHSEQMESVDDSESKEELSEFSLETEVEPQEEAQEDSDILSDNLLDMSEEQTVENESMFAIEELVQEDNLTELSIESRETESSEAISEELQYEHSEENSEEYNTEGNESADKALELEPSVSVSDEELHEDSQEDSFLHDEMIESTELEHLDVFEDGEDLMLEEHHEDIEPDKERSESLSEKEDIQEEHEEETNEEETNILHEDLSFENTEEDGLELSDLDALEEIEHHHDDEEEKVVINDSQDDMVESGIDLLVDETDSPVHEYKEQESESVGEAIQTIQEVEKIEEDEEIGLFDSMDEMEEIDEEKAPEVSVEYSGIELVDEDESVQEPVVDVEETKIETESEIESVFENEDEIESIESPEEIEEETTVESPQPEVDAQIQDLLDEELLQLLSSDEETVSSEVQTAYDSPEKEDDSIGALFENADSSNSEEGDENAHEEGVLDLSKEPISESTAKMTKKIVLGAIVLLLAAAGGVGAFYFKFNKAGSDAALPDMNNLAQDNALPEAGAQTKTDADTAPEPAMSQDINKSMTNVFSDKPAAITITKISWEVSQKLAAEETFKNYLQVAGKNLQMNLQNDLAYATDFNYSPKVKVSFEVGKDNLIKRIQVTESSGSEQIDNVVLQSIKETLKYINVPNIKDYNGNYNLSIVINF